MRCGNKKNLLSLRKDNEHGGRKTMNSFIFHAGALVYENMKKRRGAPDGCCHSYN